MNASYEVPSAMVIESSSEKLSISLDEEVVTLLYIPNVNIFEHYHISLTDEEANRLYEFLCRYKGNQDGCK